ncbi:MAG: cation diffusion facilitator family transporter [Pseudomonadota bacterium]
MPRATVDEATSARLRRQATIASICVALILILLKVGAWLLTGSITILASLLDSAVDLIASLVTFLTVRAAIKPPDRAHRFGHAKAEPLGALVQAAFVAGSALFLIFESVGRLLTPRPVADATIGVAVMVIAIALTSALVLYQRTVVARTGSIAIKADRTQHLTDLVLNLSVIAALIAVSQTGWFWLDPVAAMLLSLWLLRCAALIVRPALDLLMDRELPAEDRQRIEGIVRANPNVVDLHDLRTRDAGSRQFIELHLEVDGGITVDAAHDICDAVEADLRAAFPTADIILHQEPAGLDDRRLDTLIADESRQLDRQSE